MKIFDLIYSIGFINISEVYFIAESPWYALGQLPHPDPTRKAVMIRGVADAILLGLNLRE